MLNGAAILVASTVIVKIIGALYKMPLGNILGTVGRGCFDTAYNVYTPIFSIAMSGVSVAVLRMVAEAVAKGNYREARLTYRVSKRIFFMIGVAGTLLMFIIAYPYARFIATDFMSLYAILCIAPSIFFCYYMSSYRGYYEGLRNMMPTGISQVIEALGKLCFGLILVKIIENIGLSQFSSGMAASGDTSAVVFGTAVKNMTEAKGAIAPWAAAGAVFGVTLGSVASTAFLSIYHRIKGDGFTKEQLASSPVPPQGNVIAKNMIMIAIPMIISALVLNITNLIDVATIQVRLKAALSTDAGFDYIVNMFRNAFSLASKMERLDLSDKAKVATYLWGSYGMALDFKTLVPMITVQLGLSAIPALTTAWAVKNKEEIKSTIETVLRIAMLIAFPAGIGMAVMATPILTIIYGRGESSDAISVAAPVMAAYGYATFLMGVSTPITNMLQAIGRTDIPAKTVCIGAVVKIAANFILVGNYRLNVYGAVIGTVLFYAVIVGINFFRLITLTKVRIDWTSIFIKPFICAAFCGLSAFAMNTVLTRIIPAGNTGSILNGGTISAVISIGFAAVVYFVALLFLRSFNRDDIETLPKGTTIVKILDKYGLLN